MDIKLTQSLAMQNRSKRRIPGMTQLLSKRPDMFSLGVWPGYYAKAHGAEVTDLDGNTYVDMSISAIGAAVLGYADPDVDGAVMEAIRNGVASSLNCPEEVALAEMLCELHPWADMVRFARSGGEVAALAVRIARAYTGRDVVAVCGYHGWHDWYLAVNLTGDDGLGGHLLPGLEPLGVPAALKGTTKAFHFNKPDELKAIVRDHGSRLAAIVMEPLRDNPPTPEFEQAVSEARNSTGAVLIFDEISSGLRLNTGGAHLLHYSLVPDMGLFSKALGNGYAIAAVIGSERVMQAAQSTFISSTNWTERVGFAAGLATLRKHQELRAGERLVELGERVLKGWNDAARNNRLGLETGGIAPLGHFAFKGLDMPSAKALFVQSMLEQGFLASNLYYAMYAHTDEHVRRYLEAVDKAFGIVAKASEQGTVGQSLKGEPAQTGFTRLT